GRSCSCPAIGSATARSCVRCWSRCSSGWSTAPRRPTAASRRAPPARLVPLAEARRTFPRLPEVKFPNVLNELRLRDHSVEPPSENTAYPVVVQSTDADGNALGGIRRPLLAAPLATHRVGSVRGTGHGQ